LKRFDILHIVDSDYAAAMPASRLNHTVVTCHDLMPFLHREHGLGELFGELGRYYFEKSMRKMSRCGRVVADSAFSRDCILKYTDCPAHRVEVVHLGIDPARFHAMSKETPALVEFQRRHGLAAKEVLLHVGGGAWYKNVETVLQVVHALVGAGHSNVVLLKIGRMTSEHAGLAERLGLYPRIVMLPRVTDEELPLAYHAADLLLWPSWYEGFGLCVLEAMACGTPVVCSNGGSLPEIAGDAAAMHDPKDMDGLAASCRRVLEDPTFRTKLSDAGLARAVTFRWERTAAAYYRIYTELHSGVG
jgi:glycosyltransferase involved in cell wall biosynthesis